MPIVSKRGEIPAPNGLVGRVRAGISPGFHRPVPVP